jgi:hypothetical protein
MLMRMNCKKGAVEMQNRPREIRAGGSLTLHMGQDFAFVKGGRPFRTTIRPDVRIERNAGWAFSLQKTSRTFPKPPFRDNWKPIMRSPAKNRAGSLACDPALSCASAWRARVDGIGRCAAASYENHG